ncbi:MAG: 50S ribosomal protein L23 [Thermoleophilaceae bacterium]|nr:50S ribosomal protein L23 [Thermoleophilaceae bacterium]
MNSRSVLIRPVISEKSYSLLAANKYTFRIHPDANKTQVRQAVEEIFGVRVLDVRTVTVKPKPKRRGFSSGKTRHWKKAIVELHAEDSIELFEGQETEGAEA